MRAPKLHRTSIRRIWHVSVLAAFCLSLMLPFPSVARAETNIKMGLVTSAPVSDMGFNYLANEGLDAAEAGLLVDGTLYESADNTEYAANLAACAGDGNALCIAVGFWMAEAMATAAATYPDVNFAILDYVVSSPPDNVRGSSFNERQSGYLAGALAGKMTASNVVGAVGGPAVPPVVAYLSGYQNGVQCANPVANVLLNYTGSFEDASLGEAAAEEMIVSGADVIFGAAGATGNAAVLYATQSDQWGIGVDTDQYETLFVNGTVDGADKLLTSAMKRLDNAVYDMIEDQLAGSFASGNVIYDLSNGGVGLAPYHQTDSVIPSGTKTYINDVSAGILGDTIDINATCRPHSQIGLVTDQAGAYDNGWNNMAYQGLLNAQVDLGITPLLYEPADTSEFAAKLQACAEDGNDLCFAIGYGMSSAIAGAASSYPDTDFTILDVSPDTPPDNLRGIWFNTKQAAYLAGALAGKMTASHVIGAIGGMKIPAVEEFMEGYQNGAQCTDHDVNVLMNYTGTFGNPTLGADVAADMMSRGADVIFAPAGPTGNGAILHSAHMGTWSIGVDTDQYVTLFGNGTEGGADKLLTSVMKRLDSAVYVTIGDELADNFSSGTVTYGLSTDGVGLAPYHLAESNIPLAVQSYIEALKTQIIGGTVDINYPCRPRFHAEIVENDVQGYDWYPGWTVDMTIDVPGSGTGVDVSRTGTVGSNGTVIFSDLGGISLAPNMIVTLTHDDTDPLFDITKVLTLAELDVTQVNPATDTVSGTGPEGEKINVQYCDGSGCSWRRWATVVSGQWVANFKVPGTEPDEQQILNITPGMTGEAVLPDPDGDHTDHQWHAPDPITVSYRSINTQDGWILETGENTTLGGVLDAAATTFRLGDDAAKKQYRAILSFNTGALPDTAVITAAALKLRRQSITGGGNPFSIFQGLYVDMRKGYFGASNALQAADFQATASKPNLGPFNPTPVGTLYTITLPAGAYAAINKQAVSGGLTQVRLRFKLDDNNNVVPNYISFFSGNYGTLTSRPTLTITYYVMP